MKRCFIFSIVVLSFLLNQHALAQDELCEQRLSGAAFTLSMTYQRRTLVVHAVQAEQEGYVEERGLFLPYSVGDWLVTEGSRKTHVMSNAEFKVGYEPVARYGRSELYKKKVIFVQAKQVITDFTIYERGVPIPVRRGDWLVTMEGRPTYALTDEDFQRVYDRVDRTRDPSENLPTP